jgi:prevent-host-death family protein
MHKVGLYEARQKFSELVRRAGQGEIIGITKRGKFLAILTPPSQDEEDMSAVPAPVTVSRKDSKKRRH